jgi:S1-C subfamily serine protease
MEKGFMRRTDQILVIVFLCLSLLVPACSTKQQGIGKRPPPERGDPIFEEEYVEAKEGVQVLLIDSYKEATKLAYQAAADAFPAARVTIHGFYEYVAIHNVDFWRGDIQATIYPQMIENTETKELGVTFNVQAKGVGFNASMAPGYVTDDFFRKLYEHTKQNSIETARFVKYKSLDVKAKVDKVTANIPITYAGFKKYISEKPNRSIYEGIWSDDRGLYTLGVISNKKDPRFKFVAFILESKRSVWKPGDIKIKFIDMSENNIAISRFHAGNLIDFRLLWKVSPRVLVSVNAPDNKEFMLVKEYPLPAGEEIVAGSGTAWAVNANGVFVTNYHVVKNASEIFIGRKGFKPMTARVLIADKKTDLVLLKVDSKYKECKPIPLKTEPEANGESVCVIGYPLMSILRDSPKITGGMVSAQMGIDNDATWYQISAPIQPGNSGAPVFNSSGEVIGIAVAGLRDSASSTNDVENVNFAVKSAYLMPLLRQVGISSVANQGSTHFEPKKVFEMYEDSILPVWTK